VTPFPSGWFGSCSSTTVSVESDAGPANNVRQLSDSLNLPSRPRDREPHPKSQSSAVSRSQYSGSKQHGILAHVNQVGKKAAQKLGVFGPLRNRRSGLSVRNGVLLYKQLIRPVMDYACPIWRSAARSHVRKLQVLQSKCLRIATNAHLVR
jgi:hypothetical protein